MTTLSPVVSDGECVDPAPNCDVMRECLSRFIPIHLAAISVDGGAPVGRFFGNAIDDAIHFASAMNRNGFNVYLTPNEAVPDCGNKPTKAQIVRLRAAHGDFDPKDGEPFDKAAIATALQRDGATVVIDSGNGVQAFWLFANSVDATPENVATCEAVNKAIVARHNGDPSATNVDRLMRLPGTRNWPNARKRERGYVPCMARVLSPDLGQARPTLSQLRAYYAPTCPVEQPRSAATAQPDPNTLADLRSALSAIPADCLYGPWQSIGSALKPLGDAGRALFLEWSYRSPKAQIGTPPEQKWDDFAADRTGYRAVFAKAREHGWTNPGHRMQDVLPNEMPFAPATLTANGSRWVEGVGVVQAAPVELLPTIQASALAGKSVEPRAWHVPGMIPARNVTLLGGDGGTGKSLIALQLAVATVARTLWLKSSVEHGPSLFVTAEDDMPELHRRLADIVSRDGLALETLSGLVLSSLAGRDALLAVPDARSHVLSPTDVYRALASRIADLRPTLVVLDTLADLFGGEENNRAQARQFIGLMRRLALDFETTVLLLAHPSLSGMASGSGSSGSTGWNNSVRSRLYLRRDDDDPDVRVLRTMKSNYGRSGQEIRLRWYAGAFGEISRLSNEPADRVVAEQFTDVLFLQMLDEFIGQSRDVSPNSGSKNFAPRLFAKQPGGKVHGIAGFEAAMERHFKSGSIRMGKSDGPPSRQTSIIVRGDPP